MQNNEGEASLRTLLILEQAKTFKTNRKQIGFTQEEMAEALSIEDEAVTVRTVIRWEKGETPVPGWALSHQQYIKSYQSKADHAEHSKLSFAKFLSSLTAGFMGDAKEKIRKYLQG